MWIARVVSGQDMAESTFERAPRELDSMQAFIVGGASRRRGEHAGGPPRKPLESVSEKCKTSRGARSMKSIVYPFDWARLATSTNTVKAAIGPGPVPGQK
jgi:hypothetical protein